MKISHHVHNFRMPHRICSTRKLECVIVFQWDIYHMYAVWCFREICRACQKFHVFKIQSWNWLLNWYINVIRSLCVCGWDEGPTPPETRPSLYVCVPEWPLKSIVVTLKFISDAVDVVHRNTLNLKMTKMKTDDWWSCELNVRCMVIFHWPQTETINLCG